MRTLLLGFFLLPALLGANTYPHFNPDTVQTFKGEIASVQTFGYVTRPTPHRQIILRTLQDEEITIDLGPEWYLELEGIDLVPGAEVEVVGSLIRVEGNRFVVAASITLEGRTYQLRASSGRPLWRRGS